MEAGDLKKTIRPIAANSDFQLSTPKQQKPQVSMGIGIDPKTVDGGLGCSTFPTAAVKAELGDSVCRRKMMNKVCFYFHF